MVDLEPDPLSPPDTTTTAPTVADTGPLPEVTAGQQDGDLPDESEAPSNVLWMAVWIVLLGGLVAVGIARREALRNLFSSGRES
jgi:hypothetical protein